MILTHAGSNCFLGTAGSSSLAIVGHTKRQASCVMCVLVVFCACFAPLRVTYSTVVGPLLTITKLTLSCAHVRVPHSLVSLLSGVSNSGPGRAYAYYSDASSNFDGVLWPSAEDMFQVSPFSARGPVGRFTAKPVWFQIPHRIFCGLDPLGSSRIGGCFLLLAHLCIVGR